MKFLVDAQLPRRLAFLLQAAGYNAIHTFDLPDGNRTTDEEINNLSLRDGYVVVTKDADFVTSFLLQHKPYKLLLVSTGNITNQELEILFQHNIRQINDLFQTHEFIELSRTTITTHI